MKSVFKNGTNQRSFRRAKINKTVIISSSKMVPPDSNHYLVSSSNVKVKKKKTYGILKCRVMRANEPI